MQLVFFINVQTKGVIYTRLYNKRNKGLSDQCKTEENQWYITNELVFSMVQMNNYSQSINNQGLRQWALIKSYKNIFICKDRYVIVLKYSFKKLPIANIFIVKY